MVCRYYGVTRVVQGTQANRLICLGYDVPMFDSTFVNEKSAHLCDPCPCQYANCFTPRFVSKVKSMLVLKHTYFKSYMMRLPCQVDARICTLVPERAVHYREKA